MALVPSMPAPVPKWYRWLIKGLQVTVAGVSAFYDQVSDAEQVEDMDWRYWVARFQRSTPAGTEEDYSQFGLHIVNITGGQIDTSWTPGDFTTVMTANDELMAKLLPLMAGTHTFVGWRVYHKSFNPEMPIGQPINSVDPNTGKLYNRFTRSGPPVYQAPKSQQGAGSGLATLYQAAASITFKTPTKKHWGRVYLPGLTSGDIGGAHGRFTSSTTTLLANAFAEYAEDLAENDFQLTVPVSQHEGKYAAALNAVTEIQVDDIPDVIRRRRPKQASIRSIGVATP